MTLTFIGGVSKKLASVDHCLLEVSCQIEIEFDETCSDDADDIQRRVEKAYAACRGSKKSWAGKCRWAFVFENGTKQL